MPDAPTPVEPVTKFTVTNAHLAGLIIVLGVLNAFGGALKSYVDGQVGDGKFHQTVVDHTELLKVLKTDIDALQKSDASQKESITWLEGKLDAEKGRAYEADQQQSRLIDMLRQLIAGTAQAPKQP